MDRFEIPENMPQWMLDHVRQYIETDGNEGHMWDSSPQGGPGLLPTLLLVTTGRRSGKELLVPLLYGEVDGGYAIVASKGGAPQHPAWYFNLTAEPNVKVQVEGDRFAARARDISGADRQRAWDRMVELYPPYVDYQTKTEREIPVVVLERV